MADHPQIPPNCPFFRKGPRYSREGSTWFYLPNTIPSQRFSFDIEPSVASGKLDSKLVAIVAAYYWRKMCTCDQPCAGCCKVNDLALAWEAWEAWGGLCS